MKCGLNVQVPLVHVSTRNHIQGIHKMWSFYTGGHFLSRFDCNTIDASICEEVGMRN